MYTAANLDDEESLNAVEEFADIINKAKSLQEGMPADVECMIHLDVDEDEEETFECFYYLVHPQNRILFWMNEFSAGKYMIDIDGVTQLSHLSEDFPQ